MSQTEVTEFLKEGQVGDLADNGITDKLTEVIDNPTPVAKVVTVTVGAATNDTLYEILVDGIVSQFTSDASATETEIAAGLTLALQNNGFLDALVTVVDNDPDITITALVAGVDFTLTVTDASTGDLGSPVVTLANTAAGQNIPFGSAIVRGSGFRTVKLPDAAGQKFRGIALADKSIPNPKITATGTGESTGTPVYRPTDPCNNLRMGRAVVAFEGAEPTPADDVFFRHTVVDPNTQTLGAFTVVDDANTDSAVNVSWDELLPVSGLVVVEINRPQ